MIEITRYDDKFKDDVIELILSCQNDGTRPIVGVKEQPDLCSIEESYFGSGGYFWIAVEDEKLAGTIGLMNYGDGVGALKKFFVREEFRGEPVHLGRRLYAELLEFAQNNSFKTIVLDTPKNTESAHKFYEAAGFKCISRDDMPDEYACPYADCDFFMLRLN